MMKDWVYVFCVFLIGFVCTVSLNLLSRRLVIRYNCNFVT